MNLIKLAALAAATVVGALAGVWAIPRINSVVISLSDIAAYQGKIALAQSSITVNVPESSPNNVVSVTIPEPLIRASDLAEGQVLITGVKGEARVGPYPVQLLANIPWAREMRTGNTQAELDLTEWTPYRAESAWMIPTGLHSREVWVEFRGGGNVFRTTALVPEHRQELGTDYPFPVLAGNRFDPHTNGEVIWSQDFARSNGRWVSYDFNGGAFGNENVFYPASWASDGYIWTDNSRWRIDTPETPHSILALLVYPGWLAMHPRGGTLDLTSAEVSLTLRGVDLDLKGGTAHFYVNTADGRWHISEPLTISNEGWSVNEIAIQDAIWDKSWDRGDENGSPDVDLTNVSQLGIKFINFVDRVEPTGILAIDSIGIRRDQSTETQAGL